MSNEIERRSFLKGLAGFTVGGAFVFHNPKVLAGDLLVPSPEPTIIKAETLPERITGAGEAVVKQVSWNCFPGDLMHVEIVLEAAGIENLPLLDVRPLQTVRLFIVHERN